MNWLLSKKFTFEASHQLPHHDGKCARLHGHSWSCTVYVSGVSLETAGPKQGMLIDYADIKTIVKPIIDNHLDHWHLNESLELSSPTSERVSQWLYDQIKPQLNGLVAVRVDETCTSSCLYTGGSDPASILSDAFALG
jgi:6-pyruvoyltetrahydropterin/6-carboxytetrahydropterin synthase